MLRKTDPRFTVQAEFAKEYMQGDKQVALVHQCLRVIPDVLNATGKIKNPWPNVDAHSGALLVNCGMTQ